MTRSAKVKRYRSVLEMVSDTAKARFVLKYMAESLVDLRARVETLERAAMRSEKGRGK